MKRPDWRIQGSDPDYRFSLANERTCLAWVRTALAILAGGILLHQFADRLGPPRAMTLLAAALTFLAAWLCGAAYFRWRSNEISMRHDRPLPSSATLAVLCGGLAPAALAVAWLLLSPIFG
ncbi:MULTISPECIES: DUF202 domain-containing protein [Ramlibacter]|uniref:DUF202 domain-containing protein n=1 Tax=Ramlibacter aquaticus TaxID=2780094 RepID=A0ABR9SIT0_9BURK|nr:MULTISPECIES: DUF202 domain-containing protein [Ramlibacter]MBE7942271.1 DUF202 domain-containing protein [Ramlibacter aquaticus]